MSKTVAIAAITEKLYACERCGHTQKQTTNHYGKTWSWGHVACCPVCPPWAKYPEFGGQTVWVCLDKPLEIEDMEVVT